MPFEMLNTIALNILRDTLDTFVRESWEVGGGSRPNLL